MDINYFGLLRLAQEFGPALRAAPPTARPTPSAWVNLLSVYALANFPAHGTFSASKAAAYSLAQCLRAEMRPAGVRVINVFPGPIDDEWNQLLPPPKLAPAALASGHRQGAAGRHRGRLTPATWRRSGWRAGATTRRCWSASSRQGAGCERATQILTAPGRRDLRGGPIRVIDLTQTLSPDFPQIALPPEFGQCWPFRIEEISRYDERGPGWYWNNFSCGEHTGTHFDAPIHWISGRDLPNNAIDTIPVEHFVAPACVIDCSRAGRGRPRLPAHRAVRGGLGGRRTAASRRAPGC